MSLIDTLDKEEVDTFKRVIEEVRQQKIDLTEPKQIREIEPIESWVESPYYVGRDGQQLYDFWKEHLIDVFSDNGRDYTEIIVSGSIGCLNENTKIPTSKGLISLKEIDKKFRDGEEIKVLSEEGYKKIYGVKDNGYVKTKKIKTKQGREVEGTLNHRFRVVEDGEIIWKRFDELKEKDSLVMTRKETPFGDVDVNKDVAYFLGYLTGDGWTSVNSTKKDRENNMLGVIYSDEYNIEEKLKRGIEYLCGYYIEVKGNNDKMNHLRANNESIVRSLLEEGLGKGAKSKNIIRRVYSWNKNSLSEFLRGLFDADGTVNHSSIAITLASKKLIYNIADILSMYGINYYVDEKTMNTNEFKAWRLRIVNRKSWNKFRDEIGFKIDYKSDKLDELCKFRGYKNDRMIVPDANQVLNKMMEENKINNYTKNRSLFGWYKREQRVTLKTIERLYEIYPEWIEQSDYLKYILDNDMFFDEVVKIEDSECYTRDLAVEDSPTYCFKGFISHNTGKSTFALFAMLRKLYELSCYENIAGLFDLMSTSMIVFVYFSVNRTQAEMTGFGQFKSLLDSIPYFKENFKRNEDLNSVIQLPENLLFTHGSKAEHAIGMNLIGSILDEANFFKGEEQNPNKNAEEKYSRVADLYSSMVNRARSRFMSKGEDHSLSILVSSATHSSSFTQKRIEEKADDPTTKIIDSKLWEVKPDNYSNDKFTVFIGSEVLDPYVVDDVTDVNEFLDSIGENKIDKDKSIEYALSKVPERYKDLFRKIPVDFKRNFKNNLIKALQDIGGVSVAPMGRLFSSKPVYNDAMKRGKKKGLKHPFYKNEFVIATNSDMKVSDYLREGYVFLNRDKPRFIHIDQSTTTDSTGFAMCHIGEVINEEGVSKPYINIDLMVRINPPDPPKEISIGKVRDFVFYLRDNMDLYINKVSYDWYACISEGHKINTEKEGIVNIENIKIGDKVLTENGYKEVKDTFCYKKAPVLKIITKSGRWIEGTPNHKIKVLKEWDYNGKRTPVWEWKRFDEIEKDDVVYTEMLETDKKDYVELKGGGEIIGHGHGKIDGYKLPEYLEEDLAYIIGYYIGDGYMNEDGIWFTYNKGEFEKFNRKIKEYFNYDMNLLEREKINSKGNKYIKRDSIISSRDLVKFLNKNGVECVGGLNKYIPEIIWKSPKSVIKAFVGGLVDSDGCVDKKGASRGRIQFSNHSKDLIFGLQNLLMMGLGIKSTISVVDEMKYRNENSLVSKCQDKGYILRTVGERSKLHDIPSWKVQERLSNREGRDIYDRVEKVEKGQADVYDIEVEEENAYYVNGFYSHNSQESRQVLNESGIEAEHRSIDKTDEYYLSLVRLLYEERIDLYKYEVFENELFDLIHNRKKGRVDHPPNGCLIGDTEVRVINKDGEEKNIKIEDLVDNNEGKKTHSVNIDNGEVEEVDIKSPRVTKYVKELIRIILVDGSEVVCTPNHPVLCRNKNKMIYRYAGDIREGDDVIKIVD